MRSMLFGLGIVLAGCAGNVAAEAPSSGEPAPAPAMYAEDTCIHTTSGIAPFAPPACREGYSTVSTYAEGFGGVLTTSYVEGRTIYGIVPTERDGATICVHVECSNAPATDRSPNGCDVCAEGK